MRLSDLTHVREMSMHFYTEQMRLVEMHSFVWCFSVVENSRRGVMAQPEKERVL
jgi:hypothetical protein